MDRDVPQAPITIVSGGQTGVDRGALDAALQTGTPCSGWCPAGRRAEDGPIDPHYPLTEMDSSNYIERTRQNVIDSDGTLIIYFGELEGGSARTREFCEQHARPCLTIDAEAEEASAMVSRITAFIHDNHIAVLNVAGPRASKEARAHGVAQSVIADVIRALQQGDPVNRAHP